MDAQLLDAQAPPKVASYGNVVAVIMALVAAQGAFGFGYTLGFTSPADLAMEAGNGPWLYKAVFTKVTADDSGAISSPEAALFGSLVNVGCMIGAMLAGPLANFTGRKLALATAAVPWIGSWVLIGFSTSFGSVLAGRLISGIALGISSMTVPLYISETAPASMRGALGAVNQFAVTLGIFTVYLLGDVTQQSQPTIFECAPRSESTCPTSLTCQADGTCQADLAPWRLLAFVAAGLACALLVCALIVLPETPSFLVQRGKAGAARRVLSRLRSSEAEADEELEAMLRASAASTNTTRVTGEGAGGGHHEEMGGFASATPPAEAPKPAGLRALCARGVRQPLAIGCMLMVIQQFSGINAVIFYSADILRAGGIDDPNEGGLIVMAVQVAMTFVSVLLMDRAGRRLLLLVSLSGMSAAAGAMAAFHLNGQQPSWLALVALVVYIVAFSLGLGPIPWLLMGEIFPSHVRAIGSSLATVLNWTFSFIVTETFDYVRIALTPAGVFFAFAAICASGFVFVATCVPETKGKSLEEIEALFR